jgi:hypothetical protein
MALPSDAPGSLKVLAATATGRQSAVVNNWSRNVAGRGDHACSTANM